MILRAAVIGTVLLLLVGCGPAPGSICDDTNNPCAVGLSCVRGTCREATCSDGLQNGSETGVDCGGSCPQKCANGIACAAASDCGSGVCVDGTCANSACSNGVKDGDETDVDCGGSCPAKCGFAAACSGAGRNCISGLCTNGSCAASCTDQVKDGNETDVDCGGGCAAGCAPGSGCSVDADCAAVENGTPSCGGNVCVFTCASRYHARGSSCAADTDQCCGAACADCTTRYSNGTGGCGAAGACLLTGCAPGYVRAGDGCVSGQSRCCGPGCVDCTTLYANGTGTCTNGTCVFVSCNEGFHSSGVCVADSCTDAIKNQDETGVDCGGSCAAQGRTCPNGAACLVPADCTSQYCSGHVCASCSAGTHLCSNSCLSNTSPGSCGASCTPCPGPANGVATCDGTSCGFSCSSGFHPAGGACLADSCTDAIRNQNETAVDCGGVCTAQGRPCGDGQACSIPADCAGQICASGVCASCGTGTHACSNGCVPSISTSSCGTSCTPCAQPADPNAHATCDGTSCGIACNAGFHSAGGSCLADSCADGIRNQNESDVDCGGICVAQGRTCATGASCVSASDCASSYCASNVCSLCASGTHACSNSCVSDTSVNSCGTSCTPCPAPADPHAHATCNGASCSSACDAGYVLSGGSCVGNTNSCCGPACENCPGDYGVGFACVNGACRCATPTACRL